MRKEHALYHKVRSLLDKLEEIEESLENYDDSYRLKIDEKYVDLHDALSEATRELKQVLEDFAVKCGLSSDERLFSPKELRTKQEYERAISSRDEALKYLEKCKERAGLHVDFAEELARACGCELSSLGLKVFEYKGRKLVLASKLREALRELRTQAKPTARYSEEST